MRLRSTTTSWSTASGSSAAGAVNSSPPQDRDSPQERRYDRSRSPGDQCGARSGNATIVRRLRRRRQGGPPPTWPAQAAFVAELSDDGVLAVPLDVTSNRSGPLV